MRRITWLLLVLMLVAASTAIAGAQAPTDEQRALRTRIEAKYDVVPLSDGVALRPKARTPDLRLIEVSGGGIIVDGTPVTGRELRDRVGGDADMILRLSYLDEGARRALFGHAEAEVAPPAVPEAPPAPEAPASPEPPRVERARTSHGDRVRILGGVSVDRDERIDGQVVAVIGSVRIDGEVSDQVVAVLGSVDLGPDAVVGGDVVSVGGRVNRRAGSQVRGGITEVALGRHGVDVDVPGVAGWMPFGFIFGPFDSVARLIGTTFHFLVLALLASIALLIARVTVERSAERVAHEPLKTTLIGIIAQLLIIPAFVLVAIVLAVTIVGIPLLLLLPFAALFLALLAVAGFSGTALTIGRLARRRFGWSTDSPFADLIAGVFVVMLPLLVGRVVGLAGWAVSPLVFLLVAIGLGVEYLVWASGFGAVLVNAFTRWQARRNPPPTPLPPESATV
jgi:hypothetical protein